MIYGLVITYMILISTQQRSGVRSEHTYITRGTRTSVQRGGDRIPSAGKKLAYSVIIEYPLVPVIGSERLRRASPDTQQLEGTFYQANWQAWRTYDRDWPLEDPRCPWQDAPVLDYDRKDRNLSTW